MKQDKLLKNKNGMDILNLNDLLEFLGGGVPHKDFSKFSFTPIDWDKIKRYDDKGSSALTEKFSTQTCFKTYEDSSELAISLPGAKPGAISLNLHPDGELSLEYDYNVFYRDINDKVETHILNLNLNQILNIHNHDLTKISAKYNNGILHINIPFNTPVSNHIDITY